LKNKYFLEWSVGLSEAFGEEPVKMVKAQVPGNANLDWLVGTNMPDWKQGANVNLNQIKELEDKWWLYEAQLPAISLEVGEQLFFVTEGIDYQYRIFINGQEAAEHEGMFSTVEVPVDSSGEMERLIQIWIAPSPKDELGTKDTREEAAQSCKPAVSYGWDWHPRLLPVGIWEETYLEVRPKAYLKNTNITYQLAEDYSLAQVHFAAEIIGDGEVVFTVYDAEATTVLNANNDETKEIEKPKLWWCNGYGEPYLYSFKAVLMVDGKVIDEEVGTIGFRTIKLVMNEGTWEEPLNFPKGRSAAPITIELNGVSIFGKGSNWVNPEVFPGTITRERYLELIDLALEANFNIFRVWGGGIINKKDFYELCDERGILIWQEFMLSCNDYRDSEHYLEILEQEARSIIARLKGHPCLAIWCGGNELFNNWSKMTDQSAALRLLNKLCYELDKDRPYLMTSPVFGMAHGSYTFRYLGGDNREVYEVMPQAHNTAYTEFGVPSISNLETCAAIAPIEELFPLEENEMTIAHHAFGAWMGATWSCLDILEDYFGTAKCLEDLITWSQWQQGEGLKCIYEEARRQKPYCSMAINWCYNEPWPTLANCSIINYPSTPKKSFYDVAAACRSQLVSARIPKFSWVGGEIFSIDLWLLNDGRELIPAGNAKVELQIGDKIYPMQTWDYEEVMPNENLEGPTLRMKLPEVTQGKEEGVIGLGQNAAKRSRNEWQKMTLAIKAGEMSSEYQLHFLV